VVRLAERLVVALIPEQNLIVMCWHDVVGDHCPAGDVLALTLNAPRMLLQSLLRITTPTLRAVQAPDRFALPAFLCSSG
jgi:hypothetical protein